MSGDMQGAPGVARDGSPALPVTGHKTEACEKGMVLEGGAMRGMYTAGVLDVLMESDVTADFVIGVSAGSLHGASYVSDQAGRSIRYYEKYRGDRRFMGWYALLTTGDIVGKQFCYYDIPQKLDVFDEDAFEASPCRFYVTCTNLETGKAEYIRCDELKSTHSMELLRAGASMPLVSQIVKVDGKKYLDGGVSDSIPYAEALRMGCKKPLVILTQPAGYLKQPAALAPYRARYRDYPAFIAAMENRWLVYNREVCEVEQAAKAGKAFLIRPSRAMHVGRMEKDIHKLRALYELGRADAKGCLPQLLEYWG